MMTNEEICQSIANIIYSYRDGEFGAYDYDHVERWASQFDSTERALVLEETNKILKRNYICKGSFEEFVDIIVNSNQVYTGDKELYWRNVSALNIQINGNSQHELNVILNNKFFGLYGVQNLIGKTSTEYIYLDDFIFSGNRLYQDMELWLRNSAPYICRVCILTIGWYSSGQWSTQKKLEALVNQLGKNIKFVFNSYQDFRLENRLYRRNFSEIFWPTSSVQVLPEVANFIVTENFNPIYRDVNGIKNQVFSSLRREEYEKIMLKYGLKIMSFPSQNSPVVKPLGYSTFRGFGFGSTMFSFRNCPNNNPLAFWWGIHQCRVIIHLVNGIL
ncbi:hypothetical protein [Acinetobacter sp.]|uniref:phosphoribosyltransferase-like protein n=1 Tax=Acinetobacter sp. TaxID=472 RepID=UPI0024872722|nr:hypothetical protein [Acinetobacter sp.]MDI1222344.1 hypothetical protein [Acinetobacter sp.]